MAGMIEQAISVRDRIHRDLNLPTPKRERLALHKPKPKNKDWRLTTAVPRKRAGEEAICAVVIAIPREIADTRRAFAEIIDEVADLLEDILILEGDLEVPIRKEGLEWRVKNAGTRLISCLDDLHAFYEKFKERILADICPLPLPQDEDL